MSVTYGVLIKHCTQYAQHGKNTTDNSFAVSYTKVAYSQTQVHLQGMLHVALLHASMRLGKGHAHAD